MYARNYAFDAPRKEDVKIWRYMNFAKFMSLVDKSSLFFARPDKLGDSFEGSYGRPNIIRGDRPRNAPSRISQLLRRKLRYRPVTESTAAERRITFELSQKTTYINCWHMNDDESAAMWEMYSRRGEGIAVQSTYRRLRDSFSIHHPGYDVNIGTVQYIDYERDNVPEWNTYIRYLRKRKSFAFEHELRAMTAEPTPVGSAVISADIFPDKLGTYIRIDLPTLIEAIYVAPASPGWFKELVTSMVRQMEERYAFGREVPVIQSDLDARPLY
jgi:hypothetical protein